MQFLQALIALFGGLALGYLFGSVPFGLLLTRWAGTVDIRTIGSGNIGSTNVLRTGRRDLAAMTLLLDAAKGTLAVFVCAAFFGPLGGYVGAVGAFLGHLFPVWLNYHGGKGVATYLGCLIGLAPLAALAFALFWLLTAGFSRYSSLSALVASLAAPLALLFLDEMELALLFVGLTILLWWMHRANIARLMAGTEGRIGQKS